MTAATLLVAAAVAIVLLTAALVIIILTARSAARRSRNLLVMFQQDRDHWFQTAVERRKALDKANAILATATVRGPRGRMQRYQADAA